MSSSFKRIQSGSVKYGESIVISGDTEAETIGNLTSQKKRLQDEICKKQVELENLNSSLAELFEQKDSIIEKAKQSAEEIQAKAIVKAEEIMTQANHDKDAVINEAKAEGQKQGFEAGYNDGQDQFKLDYAKQIKALQVLTNATFSVKNEIVFSSETEILELAMLIAQKIIQVKFEDDTINVLKNMTQTAISLLKEKEDIKIVVNPKLLEYANEISPEIAKQISDLEQIKIIQDKAVSPDGVVVESVDSRIDARISTQLETISRSLLMNNRDTNVLNEEIEEKIKSKAEKVKKND